MLLVGFRCHEHVLDTARCAPDSGDGFWALEPNISQSPLTISFCYSSFPANRARTHRTSIAWTVSQVRKSKNPSSSRRFFLWAQIEFWSVSFLPYASLCNYRSVRGCHKIETPRSTTSSTERTPTRLLSFLSYILEFPVSFGILRGSIVEVPSLVSYSNSRRTHSAFGAFISQPNELAQQQCKRLPNENTNGTMKKVARRGEI